MLYDLCDLKLYSLVWDYQRICIQCWIDICDIFFCCMHEIVAFLKFGMNKLTKLSIRHFWEMIGFHVTFRVVCCFMSLKYLIFNFLNQKRTNRFWGELVKTVQMFGRADHSSKISPAFLFTFLSTVPSTFSWPLKFTVL